jgi:hypothetical protein
MTFDLLTYSLSLFSVYAFTSYLFFRNMLASLLGSKFESLDLKTSNIPSLHQENLSKNYGTALPIIGSNSYSSTKAEASVLKNMFLLKQALDVKPETSLGQQDYKLNIKTEPLLYILNSENKYDNANLSSLIYRQELDYMSANNYNNKFNKLHLSDLSSTNSSEDIYTNLILENSISSSLSSANATR